MEDSERQRNIRFRCARCGEEHDLSEISFGTDAPAQWDLLSESEKGESVLGEEDCLIHAEGGPHYFIRAALDVPVRGTGTSFTWGVWTSLSERSFEQMIDHLDDPDRARLGPYFGWLCTAIPVYPDTMFLKSRVRLRPPGLRPLVELEPTDHPLSIHQREGIEPATLQQMIVSLLHAQ